jgi:hypothetical protein
MSNCTDNGFPWVATIICVTIFGVACGFWGFHCGRESLQNEAIKAGKAEFYLDPNNDKQWRWKP